MFIYPVAPSRRVLPDQSFVVLLITKLEVLVARAMSFEHEEATKPEESPHGPAADEDAETNEKGLGCAGWLVWFLSFFIVIEATAYLWHVCAPHINGGRPLPWYAYPGLVILYYLAASALVGCALGVALGVASWPILCVKTCVGSATDAASKDGTLVSGPEGGSQGGTPSSPRVNPL